MKRTLHAIDLPLIFEPLPETLSRAVRALLAEITGTGKPEPQTPES